MDDEFLRAYSQFTEQWARPLPTPEFRVYYNSHTGEIITYSMENIPGDYIIVDKDTWHENRYDLQVVNGRLVKPDPIIVKIRPSSTGTPTHAQDVTVIAQNSATRWSTNGS
jgi:hypothetical protein